MKSVEDHEAVRLRFRLRSGSAGLLQEKKRCGLSGNDICLLCDSGEIEDVGHFLDSCVEFEGGRQIRLDELGRVEGAERWLEEFGRGDSEKRVALLLGKGVEDMDDFR